MKTNPRILSPVRVKRLRGQGYSEESVYDLNQLAVGNRFAFQLCVSIIVLAIIFQSTTLFTAMLVIAFFGVVLPNHPFDYIYNYVLSGWWNRPKLPRRSAQLKFACGIATAWLASVVYFMTAGQTTTALILAGILAVTASLPSTIDLCVPSLIYNALFPNTQEDCIF